MIADKKFYDIGFTFFILWLRLRPTAEGQSLSGPNIRLRPKVKIAPTVQHWLGDMFLWLVANLKQGVIYFIKQALPPKHFSRECI